MINFKELTKKLYFSTPVNLVYKDRKLRYNSEAAAINDLVDRLNGQFSEEFIHEMIHCGQYNIEDWFTKFDDDDYVKLKYRRIVDKNNYNNVNTEFVKIFNEANHLVKQEDLRNGREYIFYSPENNKSEYLNGSVYLGTCILTSFYNAYPELFNYSKAIIIKDLNMLGQERFDKILQVVDYINESYKYNLNNEKLINRAYLSASGELENVIKTIQLPCVLSLGGSDIDIGHCTTLIGYDKYNYIFFDNSGNGKQAILVKMLIQTLLSKIRNDIFNNKMSEEDINRKYAHIGLKDTYNKMTKYHTISNDIANIDRIIVDKKLLKINKDLFQYAFDWIDIFYINKECLKKYNMRFMSMRHFDEQIKDLYKHS